jgi:hypothetical protein
MQKRAQQATIIEDAAVVGATTAVASVEPGRATFRARCSDAATMSDQWRKYNQKVAATRARTPTTTARARPTAPSG